MQMRCMDHTFFACFSVQLTVAEQEKSRRRLKSSVYTFGQGSVLCFVFLVCFLHIYFLVNPTFIQLRDKDLQSKN